MSARRPRLRGRWQRTSLSARLVVLITVLLLVGVAAAGATTTAVLRANLVAQVDRELTDSAQELGQQTVDTLTDRRHGAGVLPSQFYVRVEVDDVAVREIVSEATVRSVGMPKIERAPFSEDPVTIPGRGSASWRAVTLPLTETPGGPVIGSVTVALPLDGVERTIVPTVRLIIFTALIIVVLGAILAWAAVRRSLRPLRQIEETAGAIAAGDLSRRVPALPPSTEVGSLAGSLNIMLSQIERSFAAQAASEAQMRRFVSDASHELRTPLSAIRGYGELYRMGGVPPERVPHALGRIESEATRMGTLVEDLLQLARLDEGRPLACAEVDLTAVAEDAASDARAQAPDRRIAVVPLTLAGPASSAVPDGPPPDVDAVAESVVIATDSATGMDPGAGVEREVAEDAHDGREAGSAVDAGPGAVVVRADADRLRQVVANLVGNVLQHTPQGTPMEIAVGTPEPGWAVLEVRDHGPGVAADDAARIFERFYRSDPSRARASGGSGLGLAIVASIIAAHGGSVRAVPTPDGGTTIQVALPLTGPAPPSP